METSVEKSGHRIKASYQKFLKNIESEKILFPKTKPVSKQSVDEIKKYVKMENEKVWQLHYRDERMNLFLETVRILNRGFLIHRNAKRFAQMGSKNSK